MGGADRAGVMGRSALLRCMDREWAALQDDADAVAATRRWAGRSRVLAGCARPREVLERVASAPDEVLLVLLEETGRGDHHAARVVLQALLPKMVRMAAVDAGAEVDDYVTALWCEVAAYPVRRRRTSVAANLALDTLKSVRRERRAGLDVAMAPHLVVVAADHDPHRVVGPGGRDEDLDSADAVLRRARQHRLVDPATRELLRSVYADGLTGEAAGRRHGLAPATVRSRCSRAVRLLARHHDLLDESP